MRIFAGDRVKAIMDRLKMPDGEAIEAGIVTRSIESAQRKVEARNFDVRKQLLEYDDVANDQRKVIYQQRNDILDAAELSGADRRHARRTASPTWCASTCRPSRWRSSGTCRPLRRRWPTSGSCDLSLQSEVEGAPVHHRRGHRREGASRPRNEAFDAKVQLIGPGELHAVRAHGAAAEHRHALARPPERARLPAPGHPPARLCAEAAQAGIQARSLRAVRPAARHRSRTR